MRHNPPSVTIVTHGFLVAFMYLNIRFVAEHFNIPAPSQIVPQVEGKLQDEKLPQLGAEIQTLVSAVPKARIERYYNDHGTICVF